MSDRFWLYSTKPDWDGAAKIGYVGSFENARNLCDRKVQKWAFTWAMLVDPKTGRVLHYVEEAR